MESRNTLKSWFQTGDKPPGGQFAALIDSFFNLNDDQITIAMVQGLSAILASKLSAPDGVIGGFSITIADLVITVQGGAYRALGVVYTIGPETVLNVNPTDEVNSRFDLVYVNPVNGVAILEGIPALNPVTPEVPAGSVLLGTVLVSPTGAGVSEQDLANYVTLVNFNSTTGDLTTLTTVAKNSLVAAINELGSRGLNIAAAPVLADEAAAVAAGLLPYTLYRTATGELRYKLPTSGNAAFSYTLPFTLA